MNENAFHLDYYTQEGKAIHDKNEYRNVKEALEKALTQFDKINESHSIRKVTIMTYKEAHETAIKKIDNKETTETRIIRWLKEENKRLKDEIHDIILENKGERQ